MISYDLEQIDSFQIIYEDFRIKEESYLILPMISNNICYAILIFVFSGKVSIDENIIEILRNLLPVYSISYENQKIRDEVQMKQNKIQNIQEFEKIYLKKLQSHYQKEWKVNLNSEFYSKNDLILIFENFYTKIPEVVLKYFNQMDLFFSDIEALFSKSDIIYRIEYDKKDIDIFYKLYTATMRRLQAKEYYFFPREWFDRLFELMSDNVDLLHAKKEETIIMNGIFIY